MSGNLTSIGRLGLAGNNTNSALLTSPRHRISQSTGAQFHGLDGLTAHGWTSQEQPETNAGTGASAPSHATPFHMRTYSSPVQPELMQQQAPTQFSHQTPFPRRNFSNYIPSPLSADALSSPQTNTQQQQHAVPSPTPSYSHMRSSSNAILQEIDTSLSNSRHRSMHSGSQHNPMSHPASTHLNQSPSMAQSSANTTLSFNPSSSATVEPSSATATSSMSSSSSSSTPSPPSSTLRLVDDARALFHLAQSRLPPPTFSAFVNLVQHSRSLSVGGLDASSTSSDQSARWSEIRERARELLNGHEEIERRFHALMHETQMQHMQHE